MSRQHFFSGQQTKLSKPYYQAIALRVRAAIQQGQISPGQPLPSISELVDFFKVSRLTIMSALEELKAQGWIKSEERVGYFVSSELFPIINKSKKIIPVNNHGFKQKPKATKVATAHTLSTGLPDLTLLPYGELAKFYRQAVDHFHAQTSQSEHLGYFPNNYPGSTSLIKAASDYLRRVRGVAPINMQITNGTQEGLYLIGQYFYKKKQLINKPLVIAMEETTYPKAYFLFKYLGAKIVPLKFNFQGLDLEYLATSLKKNPVDLIYLTPQRQYPTTRLLNLTSRYQLLQLLKSAPNTFLIEDDYDFEFFYSGQPIPTLTCLDQEERIFYLASFSKICFPGMRLGVLKSPPQFHPLLLELKALTNYHVNAINQEVMAQWIASGALDRHLRKMKKVYAQRQSACYQKLSQLPLEHLETPTGGMAIYLETQHSYRKICARAEKKNLYLTPGFVLPEIKQWSHEAQSNYQNGLRIGFCHQPAELTATAIDVLKSVIY